jgi:hypothetical protein
VFLGLFAIFGVFAAMLSYRLMPLIYSGLALAFAIWCLVTGIVLFARRDEVNRTLSDRSECRDDDFYREADNEMVASSHIFCTVVCPCTIEDDTNLDTLPPGGFYNGTAKSVTECPCDEDLQYGI